MSTVTNAATFKDKHAKVIKDITWAANFVGIQPEYLLALCHGESHFMTNVTHMDGGSLSFSVCQIKLETAQFMDKVYKLHNPATAERLEDTRINAYYAAKFLKYQLDCYNGDIDLAVDAYNKFRAVSRNSVYVGKFHKSLITVKGWGI